MSASPTHAQRVLGLNEQSNLEDVQNARRAFARKYHPDFSSNTARSTRHMARVNTAADTMIKHLAVKPATDTAPSKEFYLSMRAKRGEHSTRTRASDQLQVQLAETIMIAGHNDQDPQSSTHPVIDPNLALIQRASASYRTILSQIGTINHRSRIDIRALADAN